MPPVGLRRIGGIQAVGSWEGMVRPFVSAVLFSKPRETPSIPEEQPEAFTRCGARGSFTIENLFDELAKRGLSFRVIDDDEDELPSINYYEEGRNTQTRRVTNPDDESQYVDVEDATEITFTGEDHKLVLHFRDQS